VWFTLKDSGKVQVFDAHPPFAPIKTIDTGPITNHVNFAVKSGVEFAYVTIGGLNLVKVFRTDDLSQVATIPVGSLPHGVWPSGDGTRMYVGLENADAVAAIDTATNKVIATIPAGQAAQALVYVPNAVPTGDGKQNLAPLSSVAAAVHLHMGAPGQKNAETSVTLFDQGLIQVLQAAVTGLQPKQSYVLAFSDQRDRAASLEPLANFTANPAGAAIVNALGSIRQVVKPDAAQARRYLVIVSAQNAIVQVQQADP
jgi:YVTN family beta-propeller protein